MVYSTTAMAQQRKTPPTKKMELEQKLDELLKAYPPMPKQILSTARELKVQAGKAHQLRPMIVAVEAIAHYESQLDPLNNTSIFTQLDSLTKERWITPSERIIVQLKLLDHYLNHYSENGYAYSPTLIWDPQQAQEVTPSNWTPTQYLHKCKTLLDQIFANRKVCYNSILTDEEKESYFISSNTTAIRSNLLIISMLDYLTNQYYYIQDIEEDANDQSLTETIQKVMADTAKNIEGKKSAVNTIDLALVKYAFEKGANLSTEKAQITALQKIYATYRTNPLITPLAIQLTRLLMDDSPKEAMDIANETLKLSMDKGQRSTLKGFLKLIVSPEFQIGIQKETRPSELIPVKFTYKNIKHANLAFHPFNESPKHLVDMLVGNVKKGVVKRWIDKQPAAVSFLIPVKGQDTYMEQKDSLNIRMPKVSGAYIVALDVEDLAGKKDTMYSLFQATNTISLAFRSLKDKSFMQWLNATSGMPLADKTIQQYNYRQENATLVGSSKTDQAGIINLSDEDHFRFARIVDDADALLVANESPYRPYYSPHFYTLNEDTDAKNEVITVYTDRSLYKPGQTVWVGGMLHHITYNPNDAAMLANKEVTLTARNANHDTIFTQRLTTDKLGTFTTSFNLPNDELLGNYSVSVSYENTRSLASFEVAEYKAPSFDVMITPKKETYQLRGKSMVMGEAKTLSGLPLEKAKVRFTITGSRGTWGWRSFFFRQTPETVIDKGETEVNAQGTFEIPIAFKPIKDTYNNKDSDAYTFYAYRVKAIVTDLSGETHEYTTTLTVGNQPAKLSVEMPQQINKQRTDQQIQAIVLNLDDQPIDNSMVSYELSDMNRHKHTLRGQIKANSAIAIPNDWRQLPSGKYRLKVSYTLPDGKPVEQSRECFIFAPTDKQIPSAEPLWCAALNETYQANENPVILVGSGVADKKLFYRMYDASGEYAQGELTLTKEAITRLELPAPNAQVFSQFRMAILYLVNDGKLYQSQLLFKRQMPNKQLTLSWKSFRNRMLAGAEETWSMQVLRPDGKPATDANVASWMTDAALDLIQGYQMPGQLPTYITQSMPSLSLSSLVFHDQSLYFNQKWSTIDESDIGFGNTMMRSATIMSTAAVNDIPVAMMAKSEMADQEKSDRAPKDEKPVIRSNFNEMAYFKPQMHVDNNGVAQWTFTLPESLTKWRVALMAHTPDVMSGISTSFVEAYKEFMVEPNMPRFIRTGDKAVIGGSIRNLTEQPTTGTLTMEIFDPANDSILHRTDKPFEIKANGNTAFALPISTIEGYSQVGVRIFAQSKHFNDGEQHLLTQLPASMEVTETIPIKINEAQRTEIATDKLFPASGKPMIGKLTVEAVSNPLFIAIKQLPIMAEPDTKSAVEMAAAYFSYAMAHYLMSQPALKQWYANRKAAQPGADKSALSKNDDVKLQKASKTPWKGQAWAEEAQMKRFDTFMNEATQTHQSKLKKLLDELSALQLSDGHWSWYKGMNANAYITAYVMKLLIRERNMTDNQTLNPRVTQMYTQGWRALDQWAATSKKELEDYWKKNKEAQHYIPDSALEWLYLIAIDQHKPTDNNPQYEPTRGFFLNLLIEHLESIRLYDMPRAAIVLEQMGRHDLASKLTQSLVEHLTIDPEQGAFFAMNHTGDYWWTDRSMSSEVQTIELLSKMNSHPETLLQMQQWILGQKRTTIWNNTISTTDAVYALMAGSNKEAKLSTDKLDIAIPLKQGEITLRGEEISHAVPLARLSQSPTITIEHQQKTPVWGGIFATYEMPLAELKATGTDLTVRKELYRTDTENNRQVLKQLQPGETLKVGDIVTTIIYINLNRAMDFVALHDMRAGCMEPTTQVSGYQWGAGTGYYQEIRDAETCFFFDHLTRGEYRLEYKQMVVRPGTYTAGIAAVQSAYAPEFSGHTGAGQTLETR